MQDATVLKNSICQITDFHEYLRITHRHPHTHTLVHVCVSVCVCFEGWKDGGVKISTAECPRLITLVEHSQAYERINICTSYKERRAPLVAGMANCSRTWAELLCCELGMLMCVLIWRWGSFFLVWVTASASWVYQQSTVHSRLVFTLSPIVCLEENESRPDWPTDGRTDGWIKVSHQCTSIAPWVDIHTVFQNTDKWA